MNAAAKKVAGKLAAKVALRFIPFVGTALLAYDLYQWLGNRQAGSHHWDNPNNWGGPYYGTTFSSGLATHTHSPGVQNFAPALVAPNSSSNLYIDYHGPVVLFGIPRWWAKRDGSYTSDFLHQHPIPNPRTLRVPGRRVPLHEQPLFEPWLDPSIPHPLHPPLGKGPMPRPFTPGKIGPRIAPGTDPRDIVPGPLVGPQVRQPQPRRRRTRLPKPRLPPWLDPFPQPRVPVPLPVSDPPPLPGIGTAPIVGPAPAPGFGVVPLPPGRLPDWEWTVAPQPQVGRAPRLRPRPPGPAPVAPPPPGTKERKVGMNALGYGWALWLFNFATESRDAIEALFKALPCEVQRSLKNGSPADKAGAIYKHFDKLDVEAAFTELLLNHIEDFVIGRAHGAISKGFGSGKNWENYLRSVQASHLFSDAAKSGAKGLNRALDQFAKSLSLKRVQCGRR